MKPQQLLALWTGYRFVIVSCKQSAIIGRKGRSKVREKAEELAESRIAKHVTMSWLLDAASRLVQSSDNASAEQCWQAGTRSSSKTTTQQEEVRRERRTRSHKHQRKFGDWCMCVRYRNRAQTSAVFGEPIQRNTRVEWLRSRLACVVQNTDSSWAWTLAETITARSPYQLGCQATDQSMLFLVSTLVNLTAPEYVQSLRTIRRTPP